MEAGGAVTGWLERRTAARDTKINKESWSEGSVEDEARSKRK
jgi:hypothetical protein